MKLKLFSLLTSIFILTGCATSKIPYNYEEDKSKDAMQIVDHEECIYMIGPFNLSDDITIDEAINNTVKKARAEGLYGNKLINIRIKEGGLHAMVYSKQCIYITGNLVYDKDIIFED